MARKYTRLTVYARCGAGWWTLHEDMDPAVVPGLQRKVDAVDKCIACHGAQPAAKVCLITEREDPESTGYGELFGVCDDCAARYTAKELVRLMSSRFN